MEKKIDVLRRRFERSRLFYLASLVSLEPQMYREEMTDLIYGEAQQKYEQRKQDGALPTFCKVLDNLANNSSAHLMGRITDDPVYVFLKEAQSRAREVAIQQYDATHDQNDSPEREMDMQECAINKEAFLESLIDSMEKRGGNPSRAIDWSKDAVVNSKERYNRLLRISTLTEEERDFAIRKFIEKSPAYAWENFDWKDN